MRVAVNGLTQVVGTMAPRRDEGGGGGRRGPGAVSTEHTYIHLHTAAPATSIENKGADSASFLYSGSANLSRCHTPKLHEDTMRVK